MVWHYSTVYHTVILNTNRRDDTLACLASLAESSYAHHQIIVLDNASTDGTVAFLQDVFPHVHVIANRQNNAQAASKAEQAWQGSVGRGNARHSRRGEARRGSAEHSRRGEARPGR